MTRPLAYSPRIGRSARGATNGRPPRGRRPTKHQDFFGRLAPYLERDCLRSFTPCRSSEPRTMW